MLPNIGSMTYRRKKTYKRKDGGVSTYYYDVESKWIDGKSRQKHLKYVGKNPNVQEIPIEPKLAKKIADVLFTENPSAKDLKPTLERLGIQVLGRVKKVSIDYNPPLGSYTLRLE
jgi:hypothetical protein